MVALIGVLATSVLTGLVVAVLLSLLIVLYRASRPYLAILGRVPGQRAAYGDILRHAEYQEIPGLVMLRLDAALFFANANVADKEIRETIAHKTTAPGQSPRAVLLDLGVTGDLDVASMDMLRDLITDLRAQKIEVLFAQVRGAVRDRMRRAGLMQVVGEDHVFYSIEAAVHFASREILPSDDQKG